MNVFVTISWASPSWFVRGWWGWLIHGSWHYKDFGILGFSIKVGRWK